MRRTRKPITIHDVAQAAGVSVSTVSRVLNKKEDVALDTSEKVQAIIEDLGYASSLAARGMRSHRTNVIGLIMPDVASPYSIEVMRGVNQAISQLNYDLIIYTNGDFRKYQMSDKSRHYVMLLNGGITDGVIAVAGTAGRFPTNAPVIIIDPDLEQPVFPSIIANNREGALAAMRYLTSLGHRRIGYITGRLHLVSAGQRLQGYKDGLAEAGIPLDESLIQEGDFTIETAEECARALLSKDVPPTAIFAANDMSAMAVYDVAREMGIRIPEDLSVVGFDNLQDAALLNPPLTTVDQCLQSVGRLAIEMLIQLINGLTLENNLLKVDTRLVVRESCASIR